jgi:hypothetical protein
VTGLLPRPPLSFDDNRLGAAAVRPQPLVHSYIRRFSTLSNSTLWCLLLLQVQEELAAINLKGGA